MRYCETIQRKAYMFFVTIPVAVSVALNKTK